jgi:hypothetical protein
MRRMQDASIILAVTSPVPTPTAAPRYPMQARVGNRGSGTLLGLLPVLAAGCDPVIEIQGTFFPAWLLCMIVGVVLTIALRPLFVRLGIEPYLGPLPLIYTSLAVLLTLATWLVFFRT